MSHPSSGVMEILERRALLSAVMQGGLLKITSTAGNDQINLSSTSRGVRLVENGATSTFAGVSGIAVDAGAGNDQVRFDRGVNLPSTIAGGAGNDLLVPGVGKTTSDGGAGADTLSFENRSSSVALAVNVTVDTSALLTRAAIIATVYAQSHSNFETIIGTAFSDPVTVTGAAGAVGGTSAVGSRLRRRLQTGTGNDIVALARITSMAVWVTTRPRVIWPIRVWRSRCWPKVFRRPRISATLHNLRHIMRLPFLRASFSHARL